MNRRAIAIAVLAVLAIALAGCSSIGPDGNSTTTPTGTTLDETDGGADADAIKKQAIDAMAGTEQYRVDAEESRTLIANLRQQVQIEQTIRVDRSNRRFHASTTQSTRGQTVEVDTYLLNATIYERHPAYVRQFSTAWLSIDVSGNESLAWRARDALTRQRRVLEVAEPRLNGTARLDGTEAYRLEASPDLDRLEAAFAEVFAGSTGSLNESAYEIDDGEFTFYVATDSGRPLRVTGQLNSTISRQGTTVTLRQSFDFVYDYGAPVSIELPEAAEDAVPLSEALNESTAGS